MSDDFPHRLAQRIRGGAAPAVVGLDPRLGALPTSVASGAAPAERLRAFYTEVLPLIAEHVPVVKPNIAFFERYGGPGLEAYEATCRSAQELGLLVIGDVKRGDIGPTADAYAAYHLDCADAVTLHPYMGSDSVAPFLARCRDDGKAVFVLVRTSNPGAAELQDLAVDGTRLCDAVARLVHRWSEALGDPAGYGPVGAVVGATRPDDLARLRELMPRAWFLLPGIGAQGGRSDAVSDAFDAAGLGALLSQSRGVLQCFDPAAADWRERVQTAAADFADQARRAANRGSTP
ncbi:MAG: orotidine-5'-phosphate decarboxylase [Planctomycetota bacterium]